MLEDVFGRKYPNTDDDSAALKDFTDERDDDPVGGSYATTLGDLIVESLVGRPLTRDNAEHPQCWESFEHALLRQASLEIRALNVALACSLTTDDPPADEVTVAEISESMRSLARRVSAGAELSKRLRAARWGHPNFGGGEGYAERVKADPKTDESEGGAS